MDVPKKWKYKFTVVIPVYKVEEYVEETILSVINQTIGFEENIQMILVNDGSPDNSEEICLKYQKKYSKNILYLKKENGGVSTARNEAFPYIEGKYVNFLDSDDKWEHDAFEIVYDFFEKNYKKIDVVGARKHFFEAREDYHVLDYKFEETKVVYLQTQYDCIQLDVTSAFIKAEALGEHRFSSKLKYGEDAAFINRVILEKCALGVVREAEHRYRKRLNESSALQNELKSQSYYEDSPRYFHRALFEASIEKYGKVQEFIQYAVMYDLSWRIRKDVRSYLEEAEAEQYKRAIQELLQHIEDRIILKQRTIFMDFKIYALSLKYGKDVRKDLVYDEGIIMLYNFPVLDFYKVKNIVSISILEIGRKKLHLEGRIDTWLPEEDYQICVKAGEKKYMISPFYVKHFDKKGLDGSCYKGKGFRLQIPLPEQECEITFSIWYRKIYRKKIKFVLGKFSHLNEQKTSYYCNNHYLVRKSGKTLICKPTNGKEHLACEKAYQKTLKKLGLQELVKYREWYFLMSKLKKKKIWLVSDRINQVNDNGEHLFKYLSEHKPEGVEVYFVLSKSCPEYDNLKKYGKLVDYDSFWYKVLFLLSDKVISSQTNESNIGVFGENNPYMRDLYNFKFVFLQHGITKDDLSGWINKFNKNIKLLIAAGTLEYDAFLQGDYYYSGYVVQLTGFPRYDNLLKMSRESKNRKKKILLIPTWRNALKECYDKDVQRSVYSKTFKDTKYYKFYNGIIHNDRLRKCMEENGYEGVFCLHPMLQEQWVDFQENDVFKINHGKVDYQREFTESALLITDYSSVFFDFAYLKRPVVYAQFDKEEFFASHIYSQGAFDYERDGFGPVCRDYEETISAIIAMIENDCKLEPKYEQRIEGFYQYFDEDNCKRVTEAIKRI